MSGKGHGENESMSNTRNIYKRKQTMYDEDLERMKRRGRKEKNIDQV